jgi:hypothetical protein
VYSAQDVNDITGTINLLGSSVAYAAGKNKIINGDFFVNQRSFVSTTTNTTFGFDRWYLRTGGTGGTTTYSAQTFTPGTAPVSGYEGVNFARIETSGFTGTNTIVNLRQGIEDVRTLANQTVTVSFWAKAATGTPNIGFQFSQQFGSGGSATVDTSFGIETITTSWQRYSFTGTLPSIAGTTIGSGSLLLSSIWVSQGSNFSTGVPQVGLQNNTFDIWGVQVEQGSTATAFQTATGTIQGELAACQRYFWQQSTTTNNAYAVGACANSTDHYFFGNYPVTFRVAPTATYTTASSFQVTAPGVVDVTVSSIIATYAGTNSFQTVASTASNANFAQGRVVNINNASASNIKWSAEL